jgi:hypothetical protein
MVDIFRDTYAEGRDCIWFDPVRHWYLQTLIPVYFLFDFALLV